MLNDPTERYTLRKPQPKPRKRLHLACLSEKVSMRRWKLPPISRLSESIIKPAFERTKRSSAIRSASFHASVCDSPVLVGLPSPPVNGGVILALLDGPFTDKRFAWPKMIFWVVIHCQQQALIVMGILSSFAHLVAQWAISLDHLAGVCRLAGSRLLDANQTLSSDRVWSKNNC
jgi:hypothetical protein